ncbi:hypothetical protein PsYK624_026590 [Phanerochaete sordida]|uniref:Uncharacterized protein n=1 Tax=Phanerochaete sordida TaxID=48140 RepID=A0A9P3G2A4_9APHY|nr:hypothetical protein PsYK624_026590 [Phanerochaete sordida]
MSCTEPPAPIGSPAHKALAEQQPEITVVNIDAGTHPVMVRRAHYDVSDPRVLGALARFLEAEDALVVSLTVSPTHLALVAALRDGWDARLGRALRLEWPAG